MSALITPTFNNETTMAGLTLTSYEKTTSIPNWDTSTISTYPTSQSQEDITTIISSLLGNVTTTASQNITEPGNTTASDDDDGLLGFGLEVWEDALIITAICIVFLLLYIFCIGV